MTVIVIGGGISGLTAAYALRKLGIQVTVLEQSARPGGVIASEERDGFLFELGPQSFLSNEALLGLVRDLGLQQDLVIARRRAPRFVLVDGQLQRVPLGPLQLLFTSLFSLNTKARLFQELLRHSYPPVNDESVAMFTRRKFGAEILERLAGPLVSGVYAGDPERLSLRSAFPMLHNWESEYGSIIRGAFKSRGRDEKPAAGLCSFRGGLATLPQALARSLKESLFNNSLVESITHTQVSGRQTFQVRVIREGHPGTVSADAVVIATPAAAAGKLLGSLSVNFPRLLKEIEYAPVVVAGAGYTREQIAHRLTGFGVLVPRKEGLRVLGTVWNSSLFSGCAPAGKVLLTSFLGGAMDPQVLHHSDDQLAALAEQENGRILGIRGSAVIGMIQRHRHALPQYNLAHSTRVAALRAGISSFPGVFLIGNYLEGPSIGACVDLAMRTAHDVHRYLLSRGIACSHRT